MHTQYYSRECDEEPDDEGQKTDVLDVSLIQTVA